MTNSSLSWQQTNDDAEERQTEPGVPSLILPVPIQGGLSSSSSSSSSPFDAMLQSPEGLQQSHSPLHALLTPDRLQDKHVNLHPTSERPSFTFVCLGVGGGPLESDCSCYMLKPAHRAWTDGSIVVEGGSWLGGLTTVLQDVGPNSAFRDVDFPFDSPALRAGFVGSFAHSFLISHAHLDHILGLVLGSASLPGKRNVYGLKGTLNNLLDVFNGKIWPKLASYEDEGGPAVYRLRAIQPHDKVKVDDDLSVLPFPLSHGLNPSVIPAPPTPTPAYASRLTLSGKRLSLPLKGYFSTPVSPADGTEYRGLPSGGDRPVFTSPFVPESAAMERVASAKVTFSEQQDALKTPTSVVQPASPTSAGPMVASKSRGEPAASGIGGSSKTLSSRARRPKTAQGSEKASVSNVPHSAPAHATRDSRSGSLAARSGSPADRSKTSAPPPHINTEHSHPALDSTAFFITNEQTGKDVLFFGDVEPDSISQSPRNEPIWSHAGKQFAKSKLNAVFLECSFPASHPTEFLYGHLSVAHVFDELRVLAKCVVAERKRRSARQHCAASSSSNARDGTSSSSSPVSSEGALRRMMASQLPPIPALHTSERTITEEELHGSLKGLHVVIMHVKTAFFPSYEATPRPSGSSTSSYQTAENAKADEGTAAAVQTGDEGKTSAAAAEAMAKAMPLMSRKMDTRSMQVRILQELQDAEETAQLGVHFVMAAQGMRIEC